MIGEGGWQNNIHTGVATCKLHVNDIASTSLQHVEYYDPRNVDYHKNVFVNGKECQIVILDTADQEDYAVVRENCTSSEGFLCIFSLVDRETFAAVGDYRDWILGIKLDEQIPIILVGTNLDEEDHREVQKEEAKDLAASWGVTYIETSAKSGINVDKVFLSILKQIIQRKLGPEPAAGKFHYIDHRRKRGMYMYVTLYIVGTFFF